MTAQCHVCGDGIEQGDLNGILDHLRVMHPDEYGDGPERWPDGAPVVTFHESVDITADDFAGGAA